MRFYKKTVISTKPKEAGNISAIVSCRGRRDMPKVTFITYAGRERTVEVASGTTLMRAATDNRVDGIDGDCGGNCACATCHVYIDPLWADRVGARTACETEMLNLVAELRANSRLACQIDIDARLDGLIVATPESQH
jgi:2Fe-2S ferredoxin